MVYSAPVLSLVGRGPSNKRSCSPSERIMVPLNGTGMGLFPMSFRAQVNEAQAWAADPDE